MNKQILSIISILILVGGLIVINNNNKNVSIYDWENQSVYNIVNKTLYLQQHMKLRVLQDLFFEEKVRGFLSTLVLVKILRLKLRKIKMWEPSRSL